jgi:hypothetical protein
MLLDQILQQARAGEVDLQGFTYSAVFPIANFLAGATVTINVPINADSDFIWRYTIHSGWSAANTPVIAPDWTITFFDSGSGRNLQDQALHISCCSGTAQLPYVLPEPYRLASSSVLAVTMTNNAAGPACIAYVTFGGFKVYNLKSYSR